MSVFVDSNVLIDLFNKQSPWNQWAAECVSIYNTFFINIVVYAELSAGFRTTAVLDATLRNIDAVIVPIPKEAAFLAAKAFLEYRRQDGAKTGVLPDFFIGAHASVEKLPLITRDTRRYKTYFPHIQLITP